MSGSRRLLAALAVLAAGLLAGGLAPAALADSKVVHPFVTSFGGFTNPVSVAADDSGHVYVLDRAGAATTLSKFDLAGNPVDFAALGSNAISGFTLPIIGSQVAVDHSGGVTDGNIYIGTRNEGVKIYAADGTHLGDLTQASGDVPLTTGIVGVAVDPSGEVYAATTQNEPEISRFVPTANPPTNFDFDALVVPASAPKNIAADASGAVYASDDSGEVLRKYPAATFGSSASGQVVALASSAIAVNPGNDDVYNALQSEIAVFDSSGDARGSFGSGHVSGSAGIAVAPSGQVLVANEDTATVSVFGPALTLPDVTGGKADAVTTGSVTLSGVVNPSGVAVSDCRFEYGTTTAYGQSARCDPAPGSGSAKVEVSAAISGLDPASTYHFRLVASNANGATEGDDRTFDTAGAPGIADSEITRAGDHTAVVSARINPHFAATTYHVEYGTDTSYGTSTAETSVGADGARHSAAARLSDLEPGATYHFRFVATNSFGVTAGPDRVVSVCGRPRIGASAILPECRAYEQVSPADKGYEDVISGSVVFSTPDGGAATFATFSPLPQSNSGPIVGGYAATRSAGAWQTAGVSPPFGTFGRGQGLTNEYAISGDLSKALVESDVALTPDAVKGNYNVYVSDLADGTYELVFTVNNILFDGGFLQGAGGSADGSHFIFSLGFLNKLESTPPPPSGFVNRNLYDWSASEGLRLVGILPDGSVNPTGSTAAGAPSVFENNALPKHAVSADGSRVYWTPPTFAAKPVYLREDGQTTKVVSHDESGTTQPGAFWYATPDGSKALITSSAPLTVDASPAGADLYLYDAAGDDLTDLTPDANDAGVIGVFGTGDDGSYVYFAATGALAPGASAGDTNLYVWHEGEGTRFIGALDTRAGDITDVIKSGIGARWRVSPDGRGFGLLFRGAITGPHAQPARAFDQAYFYSYGEDSLNCASCPAEGLAGGSASFLKGESSVFLGAYRNAPLVATDGGRLFFNSPEALVPADTNGKQDVYEYEHRKLHLISTGRSTGDSVLGGASPSGESVFFLTYERLVGQDKDNNNDLYVARVGGGLASQNPPRPEPGCQGDDCQGELTTEPPVSGPGSSEFNGPGNEATGDSKRCTKLGGKADKAKHRAKRAKRAFKTAKRKARRASGRRARRLDRRADRKKERFKEKRRRARTAKYRAGRCARGAK